MERVVANYAVRREQAKQQQASAKKAR